MASLSTVQFFGIVALVAFVYGLVWGLWIRRNG